MHDIDASASPRPRFGKGVNPVKSSDVIDDQLFKAHVNIAQLIFDARYNSKEGKEEVVARSS